jgi:hypothetical protein
VTRVLADPPSRSGHILTQRELDAALRVLEALRRPQPASIIMSWDNDMQDMLGGLQRARYVETRPAYGGQGPRKATAAFRADILATTEQGNAYLASIPKSGGSMHARKRKTSRELDHEIAQSLASHGQPQLADLFADPVATKTFAKEMRHEIQKMQTSGKTAATLAARPFTVKHLEAERRALFGRYPSEDEARNVADRIKGWVEHEGRVVYGRAPDEHSTRRVGRSQPYLPNGRAKGRRPAEFDPVQLRQGTQHELEHTTSRRIAQQIAMDHLVEDPLYYVKLARVHLD